MKKTSTLFSLSSFFFLLSLLACKKDGNKEGPDLEKGLVAYFKMDKNVQSSVRINADTDSSGVMTPANDRFDNLGAMLFNGGVFKLKLKKQWQRFPVSICGWIRPINMAQTSFFIMALDLGLGIYQDDARFALSAMMPKPEYLSTTISSGWTHVTATYDGKEARLYIDGKLRTSMVYEGEPGGYDGFIIGGVDLNSTVWKGSIDDLRFYDRILTDEEISMLN